MEPLSRLASRTGLTPEEAQQRVGQVIAAAKDAADTARKAAATASLMTAFSFLVGSSRFCRVVFL